MAKEKKLKAVNLKGKEYVEVPTRVVYFNETYPKGRITTEITYEDKFVRCKATVVPDVDKPERYFVGHAEEDRTQGMVNKTNATENCETSAVGRALAMMGIGIVDAIASADEVRHAIQKQGGSIDLSGNAPILKCPFCGIQHQGQYPKCAECYKKTKAGITLKKLPPKEVVIPDGSEPPFGDEDIPPYTG